MTDNNQQYPKSFNNINRFITFVIHSSVYLPLVMPNYKKLKYTKIDVQTASIISITIAVKNRDVSAAGFLLRQIIYIPDR